MPFLIFLIYPPTFLKATTSQKFCQVYLILPNIINAALEYIDGAQKITTKLIDAAVSNQGNMVICHSDIAQSPHSPPPPPPHPHIKLHHPATRHIWQLLGGGGGVEWSDGVNGVRE